MNRREFLFGGPALLAGWPEPAEPLPIAEPHFPSRLYQFVWRNWELANASRMAEVIGALDRDTVELGFERTANQVQFYLQRGKLSREPGRRAEITRRMRTIVEAELETARRQYLIARRNSTIAFESSNHYYYRPLDLAEKILNCRHLLDHELAA